MHTRLHTHMHKHTQMSTLSGMETAVVQLGRHKDKNAILSYQHQALAHNKYSSFYSYNIKITVKFTTDRKIN